MVGHTVLHRDRYLDGDVCPEYLDQVSTCIRTQYKAGNEVYLSSSIGHIRELHMAA